MENNIVTIENMIYEIRGVQVMMDSDLARLYQCKNGTKTINQAVSRNKDRFPSDFYFQLTSDEYKNLKSHFGTSSNNNNHGGVRKMPSVFTEQGVAMLATILRTDIASQMSISIMRAFVKMRRYFFNNQSINEMIINHENRIKTIEKTLNSFKDEVKNNKIFFEGQIYDAYSFLMSILKKAKKEIIIIDNYASNELFDLLKELKPKIIIVSSNINDELKRKYLKQYDNISFVYNKSFHDRFIIIDKKKLYTCGSSFKDLGKKCFYIGEISNNEYLKELLKIIISAYQ